MDHLTEDEIIWAVVDEKELSEEDHCTSFGMPALPGKS